MNTRATYRLEENILGTNIALEVYIHCYGYINGAKRCYQDAIDEMKKNGRGFIASFIRANQKCEATISSTHGDTEYHYIMSKDKVEAYKVDNLTEDGKRSMIAIYTTDEFYNNDYQEVITNGKTNDY